MRPPESTEQSNRRWIRSHIHLGARVTELAPRADGAAGWTVSIEQGGETYEEDFDLVVIATGLYSDTPNLPHIPGQEDFQGEILHISQVKGRPCDGLWGPCPWAALST